MDAFCVNTTTTHRRHSALSGVPVPRLGRISDSNRWFGLVFREADPVVPSTFKIVATKVA